MSLDRNYLDPSGEGTGMGDVLYTMFNDLMPIQAPAQTSMSIPPIAGEGGALGDGPTNSMTQAIIATITNQGGAGNVPWASDMDSDFAQIVGQSGLSYIDTAEVTTEEQLNDNILEKWTIAAPWDDGSEQKFEQYMPVFALKVDAKNSSPGFTPMATIPLLNQMQAQLLKAERDSKLAVAMGSTNGDQNWRSLLPLTDPNAIRRRVIGGATPFDPIRTIGVPNRTAQSAAAQKLETLRFFASTDVEDLYKKINYMGPITQVYESNGPRPRPVVSGGTRGGRINHRLISTSFHNRGKILNTFTTEPRPGEGLYVKLAKFSREQLAQLTIEQGVGRNKRNWDTTNESFITTPYMSTRTDASDKFVQLRCFSSFEQRAFMGDTSELETMKPDLADLFHVDSDRKMALEWREFVYEPETGLMRERDLIGQEGEQEVRDNAVTSIVFEQYHSPGVVIPIGTIKTEINRRVTEQSILNGHYDHAALSAMPHFDIYQNHAN